MVTEPEASREPSEATPEAVVTGARQPLHGDPHGEPQGVPVVAMSRLPAVPVAVTSTVAAPDAVSSFPAVPEAVSVTSGVPEAVRGPNVAVPDADSVTFGLPTANRDPSVTNPCALTSTTGEPLAGRSLPAVPDAVGETLTLPDAAIFLAASPDAVTSVTVTVASTRVSPCVANPLAMACGARQAPQGDPHGLPQGVPL